MPKIGDRIEGIYASDSNPEKFGTFVEVIRRTGKLNNGTFYRVTDGKGAFWMYSKDSCIVHPAEPMVPLRLVEEISDQWDRLFNTHDRVLPGLSDSQYVECCNLSAAIRAAREGER